MSRLHVLASTFALVAFSFGASGLAHADDAKKAAPPSAKASKKEKAKPKEKAPEPKVEEPVATTEVTSAEPAVAPPPPPPPAKDAPATAAEKPPEKKARTGFHIAPLLGYGINSTPNGVADLNVAGPGAGLRAGYTFPLGG